MLGCRKYRRECTDSAGGGAPKKQDERIIIRRPTHAKNEDTRPSTGTAPADLAAGLRGRAGRRGHAICRKRRGGRGTHHGRYRCGHRRHRRFGRAQSAPRYAAWQRRGHRNRHGLYVRKRFGERRRRRNRGHQRDGIRRPRGQRERRSRNRRREGMAKQRGRCGHEPALARFRRRAGSAGRRRPAEHDRPEYADELYPVLRRAVPGEPEHPRFLGSRRRHDWRLRLG